MSSVLRKAPRSCDPTGRRPPSRNRRSSSPRVAASDDQRPRPGGPGPAPTGNRTSRRAGAARSPRPRRDPTPSPGSVPASASCSCRNRRPGTCASSGWTSSAANGRARRGEGLGLSLGTGPWLAHPGREQVRRERIRDERTDHGARQEDPSPQDRLRPSTHGRHHLAATRPAATSPARSSAPGA